MTRPVIHSVERLASKVPAAPVPTQGAASSDLTWETIREDPECDYCGTVHSGTDKPLLCRMCGGHFA